MAIPKNILSGLVSGVVGETSHTGPIRAISAVLSSVDEKKNLFGLAYTYKDFEVESVQVGGTGPFAGIMINPKAYRIGENYALNGTTGEFLTMGEVNVRLKSGIKRINAPVIFNAEGELSAKENIAAEDRVIGFVSRHLESAEDPHLCVIRLTEIPYPITAKGE
ncbi:phage structural protein [Xenorhabdus vietnamensis]|uniref:Phage structural protein n=1 Tax=Xenorhabdus vietnamensis TaxID=351656 RepID=A0A1Y2S7J7_9GAMM|nr:phage structural protein [Xenorhabdus vietnamensis]